MASKAGTQAFMVTRELIVSAAIMLLVSVTASEAGASLGWARPDLSPAQSLEMGVSASDAVIIGRVRAVRDSMVFVPALRLPDGRILGPASTRNWRFVDIDVQETLKGDSIATRISAVTRDGSDPRRAPQGPHQRVMCFLERRQFGWMLAWDFAPTGGVLPLREPDSTAAEARALVAAQSVESLASEAPLIVMGEFQRTTPCEKLPPCLLFRVDSMVVGAIDDQDVRVWCPIWPELSFAKAILFLRPGAGPWYELLGAHAGIIPITTREGADIRSDVDRLLNQIRLASHRERQRND